MGQDEWVLNGGDSHCPSRPFIAVYCIIIAIITIFFIMILFTSFATLNSTSRHQEESTKTKEYLPPTNQGLTEQDNYDNVGRLNKKK